MSSTAALPDGVRVAATIVAAVLAALALLAPTERGRAWAMLGALVVTPAALLAEIWETPQVSALRDRGALALAGAVIGLAVVAALAVTFRRKPGLLAVLALAALPFRLPIQSGGSTANLLVPLYVVLGAGALAWLAPRLSARMAGEPARRATLLEVVLALVVVLYAVQATYAGDPGPALESMLFFFVPFTLLFAVLRELEWTPARLRWGGGALLALALGFCLVGFWEFSERRLLLNPKVISSNQIESYFRVNSLFFDPNIYGRFLALVMLGLAGVLLWSQRPRWAIGAAVALVVLWGGLLTSLSQSSFSALLLGLAVLAWLRFGWRAVALPAVVAVVLAALVVFVAPSLVRLDLSSTDSIDAATSGRANLVEGGVSLAADRPVLGWGSGSFQREYRRHERASGREATSASHTIPITIAAEQGVVGLAAYVALLLVGARALLRGARGDPVRAVLAAAFVALVLHTWLYAAFLEDPATWTLLALALSLPIAQRPPDATAAPTGQARPAAATSS